MGQRFRQEDDQEVNLILEGFEKRAKEKTDETVNPIEEEAGPGAQLPDDWVTDLSTRTVPERLGLG